MRSFTAIAAENNSSLAVVAPGIAEALFATAIGLFAAIPAVIAHKSFSQRLNRPESRPGSFANRAHATVHPQLEETGSAAWRARVCQSCGTKVVPQQPKK